MKVKSRILTLILSLALILCITPNIAFAKGGGTVKINKTTLEFDEIIYISVNGNDNTGDGTKTNPYASITKARESLIGAKSCIYFLEPGIYLTNGLNKDMANLRPDTELTYIANPDYVGQIEVQHTAQSVNVSIGYKTTFIGLILNNLGMTTDPHSFIDYTWNGSRWENYFYNCVFTAPSLKTILLFYGNNNFLSCNIVANNYENCLFVSTNLSFISGLAPETNNGVMNTAFTGTFTHDAGFSSVTGMENAVLSDNYQITNPDSEWKNIGTGKNPDGSKAHIGVYGGEFAWKSTAKESENEDRLYVLMNPDTKVQLSLFFDLNKNKDYIRSSTNSDIASVDENGMVTALSVGTTLIYCESSDGTYKDYIPVKVLDRKEMRVLSLHLDLNSMKTQMVWLDDDASAVTWKSSNTDIATIDSDGLITANGHGICSASGMKDGKTYYINIRVN